jgi:hypothetical protein
MAPKCSNCDFFTGSTCRRYAPRPSLTAEYAEVVWPKVRPNEFCGDWSGDFIEDGVGNDEVISTSFFRKAGMI